MSAPAPFPEMVWIPGGMFLMGSDRHYPEEAPAHRVAVDGFWMDRHAVTNAEFARFVAATGWVTLAERPVEGTGIAGTGSAGSAVFRKTAGPVDLRNPYQWWTYVVGADWRHPHGPTSTLAGLDAHPVVQIAWEDAAAYAAWAGKTLPTEAEWERAARGGLDGADFVWGDELAPGGRAMANTWQGEFPWENLLLDGFAGTAPVGSFPPNGYGLFDVAGNVWELTDDWYEEHGRITHACCTIENPRGAAREASVDPLAPHDPTPRKVMKGGSYLCAPNYCQRYRPAARLPQPLDTATCHVGFRCVVRT